MKKDDLSNLKILRNLFDILKEINNLGIIPDVLGMAKHSKYKYYPGIISRQYLFI